MLKKIFKITIFITSFFLILVGLIATPLILNGYNLYNNAITQTSLEEKVNQIKSQDDYVAFDNISPYFLNELVTQEDHRFYKHNGFDIISFTRACLVNLTSKTFSQGGSTITQQLAKNMYFDFNKNFERKIAELFMAFKIEKNYSKNEILELYANIVYFGQNCYGIQQASQYYYGVNAIDLTPLQAEELVDALKAPSVSNPFTDNN